MLEGLWQPGSLAATATAARTIFIFSGMAVIIFASVFVGFARTYYLAGVFKAPLPNLLVHIHGVVFSCWILLLIVQTSLVASGRVDVHRRLELPGFGLACLVVILRLLAATDSLARHFVPGPGGMKTRAFFTVTLSTMLAFGTLICFCLSEPLRSCRAQTSRPDRHNCSSGCGLSALARSRRLVGGACGSAPMHVGKNRGHLAGQASAKVARRSNGCCCLESEKPTRADTDRWPVEIKRTHYRIFWRLQPLAWRTFGA